MSREGGYDRNIYRQGTLVKAMEYIHYNPVQLKLAETPVDWYWSSARFWTSGDEQPIKMDIPI